MSNRIADQLIPASIGTANNASHQLRILRDILAPLGIVGLPGPIEHKRRNAFEDAKEAFYRSMEAAEQLTEMHALLTAPEQSITSADPTAYALEDAEKAARKAAGKIWTLFEALERLDADELPTRTRDRLKTLTEQAKRYQGGLYTISTNLDALRQELEEQDKK